MRLKSILPFLLVCSGIAQTSSPPSAKVSVVDALKEVTFPIRVDAKGDLADTGGKLISDSIERAQFVLLGESHISQETPKLAAAICHTMHPDSYGVEAGPYAAAYVNGLLKIPDRPSRMRERQRTHPANMALLDIEQENDLAATCAASSHNRHFALWGLDQEFLGAASVLLVKMEAQRNGPKAAAAIRSALEKDRQAEASARSSGDALQLFLVSASDSDVADLQVAVDADGTPESRDILRELIDSRRIYHLNAVSSPDSNSERASLLKRHFMSDYRALQQTTPAPHILLKLGDNHMWKGFNDLHQLDLGDFVAELASVEQTTSLHIQVLAAKGTLPDFAGYARPMKNEPFVLADIPEYAWLQPVIRMLPPAGNNASEGVVVDLRKLRFRLLAMSSEWQHLVYGYDMLVVLPEFTPANLYK
jgi:hypothetical protein